MMDDQEQLISAIESWREQLHELIDQRLDEAIQQIQHGGSLRDLIHYHPLSMGGHILKGTKPVSVRFSDGRKEQTRTWKEVAAVVLKDCNSSPVMHERLMDLREKVHGRDRVILGATPVMDVPIKIDEDLYFESKYDTETLIHVLTERLLRPIGYDFSGIDIQYLTPDQVQNLSEDEPSMVPLASMEMTM